MKTSARIWSAIFRCLVSMVAVLWLTSLPPIQAQKPTWSEPIQLSLPGQFAWFPDIAVDLAGQIHVVYASGTLGANRVVYDSVMYTTSPTGETWSTPNDIFSLPQPALGESAATRPALLVDMHNHIHIAFTDYFRMYYSQAPAEDAANASAWTRATILSSGTQSAYFGKILQDALGRLGYLYTENVYSTQCPACYHLYFRYSDDRGQTWSSPLDISQALTGAAKPQVVVDLQGNYHVVWDGGRGGALGGVMSPVTARYAASYERGQAWTSPIDFTLPMTDATDTIEATNAETSHVTIGVDGRNQLVVVWLSMPDEKVFYQVSNDQGRSWSTPAHIPGVFGGMGVYSLGTDTYAMGTDGGGNIHLVLVGRRDLSEKTLNVLHVIWDGASWSKPEPVVSYKGDAPEWPRLAVRNGNELHLVWFVRNREAVFGSEFRNARYQVWYSRTILDLPPIPPGPIPTRAPSATPTAAVTATPGALRATATPTFAGPLPTPSEVGVYRENDYLLIAARSALPVVGLIIVIFAVVWWRRR